MWEKRNPHTLLVGMYTSATTMEISMEDPQKVKSRPAYDPAIPLLAIYSKECKSICKRNTRTHTHVY
jgi:hypothetical protein